MAARKHKTTDSATLWEQIRSGLPRHVLSISRHLQSSMMDTLQRECGHTQLRLSFTPYITLIGERDFRPSELAKLMGITRQACNQTVRQLESAGYVGHVPDPKDGRAKLLTLTRDGRRLRRDGLRIASRFDKQFASLVAQDNAVAAAATLRALVEAATPGPFSPDAAASGYDGLAGLLPRLSDHITLRLMALTQAKGHPQLKLSFGQVIPMIGPNGGRIQEIAALQDVSKQAISAISIELEELGYIQREQDPEDARQIVLHFTRQGLTLMADSACSAQELEQEFSELVGRRATTQLADVLQQIFTGLGLDLESFNQRETVDLQLLAQQLKQQLGGTRCAQLAQLLSDSTQN